MDQPNWLLTRPIAHRGLFDSQRPENSMAAFRHALSRGMPFELDVHLARDGLLVVVHDRDLMRMTGRRIATADIDRKLLGQLRLLSSEEPIPLLAEVLEEVNGRVPVLLDLWHPAGRVSSELERRVASLIRDYPGPLAVQSFHPLSVLYLRRLISDHPVGQVSGRLDSVGRLTGAVGRSMATNLVTRPDFVNFELAGLPARSVEFWRDRRGIPVVAWTVRSADDEDRAKSLASNFLFDSYLPSAYRRAAPDTLRRAHMTYRTPNFKNLPDIPTEGLLKFAEEYAQRIRQFYDSRAQWHRRLYRFSGIMVIFAGALLPLLAALNYSHKTITISLVGVFVSLVTALRAFYHWDQGWVLLRQTEFNISGAYWEWKGKNPHPDDKAASELLLKIIQIREREAESFFKNLTFPDQKK